MMQIDKKSLVVDHEIACPKIILKFKNNQKYYFTTIRIILYFLISHKEKLYLNSDKIQERYFDLLKL